jgi:hypothetical protein
VPVPVLAAAGCEAAGAVADVAAEVAGAVAEVTAEVAAVAADVTAEVAVEAAGPVPVLVLAAAGCEAAGAAGAVAAGAAEVAGAVAGVAAGAAAVVTAEVAAEVAAVAAVVAAEVADVAADVTADVGKLAACACRENVSKTARMPTATIAACTARRAMRRNTGWGTGRSRPVGTGLAQGCQDRRDPGSHNERPETTGRWKLFTRLLRPGGELEPVSVRCRAALPSRSAGQPG